MKKLKSKTTGRPPRTKDIIQAKKLRMAGLTIRAISWAILKRDDPKTIHRWLNYSVG